MVKKLAAEINESESSILSENMIKNGKAMNGYCLDGGSAAHFVNEKLINAISFYTGRMAVYVQKNKSKIIEKELPHLSL